MDQHLARLHFIDLVERVTRRSRIVQDRSNPFEKYDDEGFIFRFRFPKHVILETLLPMVQDQLQRDQQKESSIPPILQLLISLQFYGSSDFLRNTADLFGVNIGTVSRILPECSRAIASHSRQYITFATMMEIPRIQEEFHAIAGLPGIVGAIDCTHVAIRSPGLERAELFRNRKGFFSINVQAICDANLIIRNLVVRWPGSTHDSRIFDNSEICAKFDNHEVQGLLLGDNGYPLRQYLMTPLLHPATPAGRRYNAAHTRSRVKIENLFGVWKRRFPCLSRTLALKLDTTLAVIVACGVLHNLARQNGITEPQLYAQNGDAAVPMDPPPNPNQGGHAQRNRLIELFQ